MLACSVEIFSYVRKCTEDIACNMAKVINMSMER